MTDEVSFPSPKVSANTNTSSSTAAPRSGSGATRVRGMTQSSKQSTDSAKNRYHHVPRPLPVWVMDGASQQGRHRIQQQSAAPSTPASNNPIPSYFDHSSKPSETSAFSDGLRPYYNDSVDEEEDFGGAKQDQRSRWNTFKKATTRPEIPDGDRGQVDEKALLDQYDFSSAWLGGQSSGEYYKNGKRRHGDEAYPLSSARYFVSEESRKIWKPRLAFILLNNPYVPLTLRAIIFILSVAALGLAGSIFEHSTRADPAPITQQPSTIMAVVVQSAALVYLVYITYDEYSGKPLGLREPKAKMRLIMLDLLFIIFSSANLSLTFNTLYDATWTCHVGHEETTFTSLVVPYNYAICSRQRGLAAFLFMVLVMWVTTFTVSIFRLVERVTQ